MQDIKLQKGKLLIAKPSILNDDEFSRSIILLTEHNKDGTVGFILNKSSDFMLADLIPEINAKHPVYLGGPVSEDNLYFIHCIPDLIPDSVAIGKGIFWGGNFDVIQDLLVNNSISKNDIRFFLGYTGWSEHQLEDELEHNSWLVKKNGYSNILKIDPETFWKKELLKTGGEYTIWANAPSNPRFN